jgi:hypothetical protein
MEKETVGSVVGVVAGFGKGISRGERMALWVTAAIIFAVVVWAWVSRRNALAKLQSNQEQYNSPYYMNYNYPIVSWNPNASSNPVGTAAGLPQIPAAEGSDSSCGCGGGTNGFYTSLNQMLQSFQQNAQSAFQSYISNITSSIPSYEDQYINNPVAATQSQNAGTVFG